jgi:hypothetical protein
MATMTVSEKREAGDVGGKVFAVSEGSYSDYRIVAIFSTREKAQEYIDSCHAEQWSEKEIEEYDLDLPREELPGCYEVRIKADGTVIESTWASWGRSNLPADHFGGNVYADYRDTFRGFGETTEHARRSAEELRRATIATRR